MKLFIWDFHGVLEKGNENAVIEISNKALEELGYLKRFTWEDCDKYYGLKWFEYFEQLLPNCTHEEYIELQNKCFQISDNNPQIVAKHMEQNDFADEVLNAVAQSDHRQILLSNTHKEALDMFIRVAKVENYFSSRNIFAADAHKRNTKRDKAHILSKILDTRSCDFEEIISIGDSEEDILLVKDYPNSKTYLYAHPKRKYKEAKATYKIRDLREILREV